jgi:hypothetical protein
MNAEQRRIAKELMGIAKDMADAGLALTVQDGRGGRAAGWALQDIETCDTGLPFVDSEES